MDETQYIESLFDEILKRSKELSRLVKAIHSFKSSSLQAIAVARMEEMELHIENAVTDAKLLNDFFENSAPGRVSP